jgi:hypothetical protein
MNPELLWRTRLTPFFGAFALGILLWVTSEPVIGHTEPWDSAAPYYSAVMMFGGIVLGVGWSHYRAKMWGYLGAWLGQFLGALLVTGDRSWWLLGLVSTGVGSLWIPFGMWVGGALREKIGRHIASNARKPHA